MWLEIFIPNVRSFFSHGRFFVFSFNKEIKRSFVYFLDSHALPLRFVSLFPVGFHWDFQWNAWGKGMQEKISTFLVMVSYVYLPFFLLKGKGNLLWNSFVQCGHLATFVKLEWNLALKKTSALNFYGPISMSSMLIQIFFEICNTDFKEIFQNIIGLSKPMVPEWKLRKRLLTYKKNPHSAESARAQLGHFHLHDNLVF